MYEAAEKDGFCNKFNSILDQCPPGTKLWSQATLIPMLILTELSMSYVLAPTDMVAGTTTVLSPSTLKGSEG